MGVNSEREIIRSIQQKDWLLSSDNGIVIPAGDDCALLSIRPGMHVAVTTDTLCEDVHFNLDYFSPEALGFKTAAVNLSDMAAMGAIPKWAFLNLALPVDCMNTEWINSFCDGLKMLFEQHGAALAGGDTVLSQSGLTITLTLIGEVEQKKCLARRGASPGDIVFCSGFTGESGAGLEILQHAELFKKIGRTASRRLVNRHLRPVPRVKTGRVLLQRNLATAATDVSDGISTDLAHICEMSEVAAVVDAKNLPVSRALASFCRQCDENILDKYTGLNSLPLHLSLALSAGEDFELLWTAKPDKEKECIDAIASSTGQRPFKIGQIITGKGVFVQYMGREINVTFNGYEH